MPLWIPIGEVFYVSLILGVVWALWRSRREVVRRENLAPALLTGLALLLRFMAHPGPADIRSVLGWSSQSRAGWVALLHLLYRGGPPHDEIVWNLNRVVGACSVPLLYAIMRRRFVDPAVAVGGAAALAVTPLIVRFSASDTPYILLCGAMLGGIVALDRHAKSGALTTLILALGLLTTAMQLRPDAPWLVVPVTLLAVTSYPRSRLRALLLRPGAIISVLLFLGINTVPATWAVQSQTTMYPIWNDFVLAGSIVGSPWADSDMTPPALGALVILGAVSALLPRWRRSGMPWLAAAIVAWPFWYPAGRHFPVPLSASAYWSHNWAATPQYANARYHLPAMYLACGLIGLGVVALLAPFRRVVRRIPGARVLPVGLILLAALPGFGLLNRMWAPQSEFDFFRAGLGHIDRTCRVVTLSMVSDAGFVPFPYLMPDGGVDVAEFLSAPPQGGCFVYYRSGNCYASSLEPDNPGFEMNAACRAIERRFRLEPILQTEVTALPYRGETYARDPLPVGFYRLEGPSSEPISR